MSRLISYWLFAKKSGKLAICVHVYDCAHVSVYASAMCMYLCVCIYVHVPMHVCAHALMHACAHMCAHVCRPMCVYCAAPILKVRKRELREVK